MKLLKTEGLEPIGDTNSQPSDEAITNYINSIHPDVTYQAGSNAIASADTQPAAASTVAHAMSHSGSDYYGVSLRGDDNEPMFSIFNGAGFAEAITPPPYVTLRDGLEFSFAMNLFAVNASPIQFQIPVTTGGIAPFLRVLEFGFGTSGWIGDDGSPLVLAGTNAAAMPTDGTWVKVYLRVWKSGTDLKVSMATSVDAVDVVTYTEAIGTDEFGSVSYGSTFGIGNLDDISVWEVEPADIATLDANLGLFDFQKHIKMYMVRGGNKDINGTPDTWVGSDTTNFGDVTDSDLGTNSIATEDELGIEQVSTFASIAALDGVNNPQLKSLGYVLVLKDDGGQFGLKIRNGGNEVDKLVATPSSPLGVIRSQSVEGEPDFATLAANAGTNGMKFTARKTI